MGSRGGAFATARLPDRSGLRVTRAHDLTTVGRRRDMEQITERSLNWASVLEDDTRA